MAKRALVIDRNSSIFEPKENMKNQMKNKIKLAGLTSIVLALGLASTGVAWAAGTHAHSHDHGQKETARVIGKPGKASQVKRSISIDMTDKMRFTPSRIDVKKGETVRFLVKNSGQLKHELVLGTPEELAAHYKQMLKFPGMEHEDPQMVSVAPGKVGEIVWTFDTAGAVDFACLQAGHFDAGMQGKVAVK
jgi:uncharacterized cupredoxin-like copper-binding protein